MLAVPPDLVYNVHRKNKGVHDVKKFLKILGIILLIFVAAAIVLWLSGTSRQKFEGTDAELSSWMAKVSDDAALNRIAIPGSHDSGTAGITYLGETQTYSIKEQLESGARYFDIRVHKDRDKLKIFHSIFDGVDFDSVLDDIADFITAHPSEVLLLDFQHFKGDSQNDVYALLDKKLHSEGLCVENTREVGAVQFIRELKLGDVRGKCIIFWGDRDNCTSNWLFPRNDDECTFDNMCLDSYYIGSYHKSDSDTLIKQAYPVYFAQLDKNLENGSDAIFVLQAQLTDGKLIFGPWSREKKNDPIISEYIRGLAASDKLEYINIIMRDFITPEKCADIIALNSVKGIMSIG